MDVWPVGYDIPDAPHLQKLDIIPFSNLSISLHSKVCRNDKLELASESSYLEQSYFNRVEFESTRSLTAAKLNND